jgi:hypothetical protein
MEIARDVVTFLGGATALLAAIAWLVQALVKTVLARDLKSFENDIKGKADQELAILRAQLKSAHDHQGRAADAEAARDERIRAEILKWANPILGAVADLSRRLDNILKNSGYLALQKSPAKPIPHNWSISYDYFMPSTLYLFCQYFYWVRRLQIDLSFELFAHQTDKDTFLDKVGKVSSALGQWPLASNSNPTGTDMQLFTLQQRLLGDAVTVRQDNRRCMGYDEFVDVWDEAPLADHLAPLRALLDELDADNSWRWIRLNSVLAGLQGLEEHCRLILRAPAVPVAAAPISP